MSGWALGSEHPDYGAAPRAPRRLPLYWTCLDCGGPKGAPSAICRACRPRQWARHYDRCIDCGKTDRPHAGHGLCTTCKARHRPQDHSGEARVNGGSASALRPVVDGIAHCNRCGLEIEAGKQCYECRDRVRRRRRGLAS